MHLFAIKLQNLRYTFFLTRYNPMSKSKNTDQIFYQASRLGSHIKPFKVHRQ